MDSPGTGTEPPDHAQVAFPPPLVPLLGIVVGLGAGRLWPLPFLPTELARPAGRGIVVIALALFVWAIITMLRGRASLPPHLPTDALVFSGPYRFTRNPIYLAMVVILVGFGVAANNAWFLPLAAVAGWLLHRGVILREESYLQRKFGGDYDEYRRRVRRWI